VNVNSTRRVVVEPGGTGVVAHVGLHAVGSFADRMGLSEALSARIPWAGGGIPLHDRGKVLTQAALMLAGGGESCLDIEHLRVGEDLFGSVPSDTTLSRTFHEISPATREGIAQALAKVRAEVWRRSSVTNRKDPVLVDIDASLVEIHSENKEQAAPTYKGTYGFHPMFLVADATGETLSARLRPGNAGANTVEDHLAVLDAGIAQLPSDVRVGHCEGDDPVSVNRGVVVRADSAGCTAGFLAGCRARNIGFYVSARSNAQVTAAIFDSIGIQEVWMPAISRNGQDNDEAVVAELSCLIDTDSLPEGTRLIVRREPLHPGAQRSLFPSLEHRYFGFYTDQEGDPRDLDLTMREHAHVEQHIGRLKDSGLERFPFSSFEANSNWLMTVCLSADLLRWFQLICLDGHFANARPKALRWSILHAPARLVHTSRRTIVRIISGWPTEDVILEAYRRIALIT